MGTGGMVVLVILFAFAAWGIIDTFLQIMDESAGEFDGPRQ